MLIAQYCSQDSACKSDEHDINDRDPRVSGDRTLYLRKKTEEISVVPAGRQLKSVCYPREDRRNQCAIRGKTEEISMLSDGKQKWV